MNNFNKKIPFWIATIVYVFSILIIVKGMSYGPGYPVWIPSNIQGYKHSLFTTNFSMLEYYAIPYFLKFSFFYLLYLLIIFKVLPKINQKKRILLMIAYTLMMYVIVVLVIAITNRYLQVYQLYGKAADPQEIYYHFFFDAFLYTTGLFFLYGIYALIKFVWKKTAKVQEQNIENIFFNDCSIAYSIWILIFSFVYNPGLPDDYTLFWLCMFLSIIFLYGYFSLRLIPSLKQDRLIRRINYWPFLKAIMIFSLSLAIPYCLIETAIFPYSQLKTMLLFASVSIIFHCIITAPLSLYLYNYRLNKRNELTSLKTSLNQSTANIELLRSQINPHFLFNTLNSLYGIALLDNSKRTALGIQKLGDMMRFMLHENHHDKILLIKEIAYIKNYIELQNLRIPTNADVLVEADIYDLETKACITPMVLIPFIENAFKYGISNDQKSWIKIKLSVSDDQLTLRITNSIHIESNPDVNRSKSGIGLDNVKQRLLLTYPNDHKLEIQSDKEEFSVNLSLNLTH